MTSEGNAALQSQDPETHTCITFRLHNQLYGIKRSQPYECAKTGKIVPIRGLPDFMRGAMIWRNRVVPVVDLKRCLDIPDNPYFVQEAIIIFYSYDDGELLELGILVDSCPAEITLSSHEIPPLASSQEQGVLGAIETENGVVTLVDMKTLLLDRWNGR